MKLSRLLEIHHSENSHALKDNLGDGYLCKHNRIYANIRKACLEQGFRLSSEKNDLYAALPLSQLETIFSQKIIPYTDNVSVLKDLEQKHAGMTDWADVSDQLKRNFIFHESCHIVARSLVVGPVANEEALIFQRLFEESFANTCELLAICDVEDKAHQIFYEMNSYTYLLDEKVFLKKAIQEAGKAGVFKFLLLCYLHSNFLIEELSEVQMNIILKRAFADSLASLTPATLKNLRKLSQICFTLDETFKYVTTRFYLRLNGIKKLPPFDFMKYIDEKKLNALVHFATS